MRTERIVALAIALVTAGCIEEHTACDCPAVAATIRVPKSRLADIQAINLTGSACPPPPTFDPKRCEAGGDCFTSFVGRDAGRCHVQITFKSGGRAVEGDFYFVRYDGSCCGDVQLDPGKGPNELDIPPLPDAGSDA